VAVTPPRETITSRWGTASPCGPCPTPGLQASYFGLYGKGNASSSARFGGPFYEYFPDWIVHLGFLSYQHPWFTLTAQTFAAKGN